MSATAGLLAAAVHLVHRRPGPPFGFVFRNAALFVPFFDMLGLTLLLVAVFALVSAWHMSLRANVRKSSARRRSMTISLSRPRFITSIAESSGRRSNATDSVGGL